MGGWEMKSFTEGMRAYFCFSKQSRSRLIGVTAMLALALLMSGLRAAAQSETNGAIEVNVTDPQGLAVPKASLSCLNTGTGQETQALTNDQGQYRFVEVQPGSYKVTVT